MRNKIFILLGIILIVLVIGGISIFFLFHSSNNKTTPATSGTTFPVSNTQSGNTGTNPSNNSSTHILVSSQNGAVVPVNDFINNGETIADTENKGNYLLAGSLGYCLPNMKCTAATSTDYNIGYDGVAKSFTIALLKEPLGNSRKEAEQFLMTTLGITQQQMCSLNYYVGTTYFVNESYDSSNLGFSFCPGAVALP